jgi:YjbE family integral membrane protein
MIEFFQTLNWVAVAQIILIDILLGGDNAIVIALACRRLPDHLRFKGILWGTAGAIVLRIVLISFAINLLNLPWLKAIGGLLLLWIGVKLLVEADDDHDHIDGGERLWSAVKTILIADVVMSVDNVVGVASAAEQNGGDYKMVLVTFGILVSIPIVIWGSSLVLKIMDRFPAVVTGGAALLGYLGGEMLATDLALKEQLFALLPMELLDLPQLGVRLSLTGALGALGVVALGWWIKQRDPRAQKVNDGSDDRVG